MASIATEMVAIHLEGNMTLIDHCTHVRSNGNYTLYLQYTDCRLRIHTSILKISVWLGVDMIMD